MAQIAVTGATGQIGRFLCARLHQDGHELTFLGRSRPEFAKAGDTFQEWHLSDTSVRLRGAEALVHCALAHQPGKYRGGEGDDPHGFIDLNVDGTLALFKAARDAGVRHTVFLSSRAVYTPVADWAILKEAADTNPDTLYGQVKLAGEQALAMTCETSDMAGTALRVTGVYGCPPGMSTHKWSELFEAFERGAAISPRVGTEVHGDDLASALALVLDNPVKQDDQPISIYNVSDVIVDRQDLLSAYAKKTGIEMALPPRAPGPVGVLSPAKLAGLGWVPGGKERLQQFVQSLPVLSRTG